MSHTPDRTACQAYLRGCWEEALARHPEPRDTGAYLRALGALEAQATRTLGSRWPPGLVEVAARLIKREILGEGVPGMKRRGYW